MKKAASELLIGWATEDITPEGPASLFGQYYERISQYVESRLTVTACAMEATLPAENGTKEHTIMISMDILWCTRALQEAVRRNVQLELTEIDVQKLFLFATHTHSAPEPAAEGPFGEMLVRKITMAAVKAWSLRKPMGISRSLGYAVAGHNRRVQYADGSTEMYGVTDRPDFIGLEGPADSSVDMLFCWDKNDTLAGIILNVPCPSQVTEAKYYVSADYWSEVRKQLQSHFSHHVFVLAQCGAAGDISPRDLTRNYKGGGPDMWDVPGMVEIGKRLVATVMECYPEAKKKIERSVVFKHGVTTIQIPSRTVSREEYEQSLAIVEEIRSREPEDSNSPDTAWNRFLRETKINEKIISHGPWDNKNSDYGILRKRELAVKQYEEREANPFYLAEVHIIRINEIAFASNPFELFVDYGFAIKSKSKAIQTFLIQLSCDYADYLPTERAIKGGGYSGMSTAIGHDGGLLLVEQTVKLIHEMWK